MHLNEFHNNEKSVSVAKIFEGVGQVMTLRIKANSELKKHTTPIPALLICVEGQAVFEYENGKRIELTQGNYVNIEPDKIHRVFTSEKSDALLLLIK